MSIDKRLVRGHELWGPKGHLRISRSKFHEMIADGLLPPPLKCGRVSLWFLDEVLVAFQEALK